MVAELLILLWGFGDRGQVRWLGAVSRPLFHLTVFENARSHELLEVQKMNRFAIGAALGGLAAYLYDPAQGSDRRGRLSAFLRENQAGAVQAGRAASETIDSVRPLAQRVTRAVGRRDLAQVLDRRPSKAIVPGLLGAAAVGGAIVYFMDPVRGSERRRSTLDAGRHAFGKMAKTITDAAGRAGDDAAGGIQSAKSRAS